MPESSEVTELLLAWREGDAEALDRLMPLVYDELRRVAEGYLKRESSGHTLQATALVHEAYLRLVGKNHPNWHGRIHFYTVAAKVMRRILVDHARGRRAVKRGRGAVKVPLDSGVAAVPVERPSDLVALDEALSALAALDPRKARVIELRFFGGLTIDETAQALEVSTATVVNETRLARAWLYQELRD